MENKLYLQKRLPLLRDLGFRPEGLSALEAYVELLWSANEELNLFSRKMSFPELIDNHIIDCSLPLSYFPKGLKSVADFGSGGGMPGVIYALQYPEISFQLFEKSILKQGFLKRCLKLAPNLTISGEIPSKLQNTELVTARAFKPLDVILDLSRQHYARGGKYFLLKGRRDKIDEEIGLAKKKFKDLQVVVQPLQSPLLEVERNLVMIG